MEVLERYEFEAADLVARQPPRWRHPHKEMIYRLCSGASGAMVGRVGYSRWRGTNLPDVVPEHAPAVESRATFYDYHASVASGVAWQVNFADPELFYAYGSALLAQDELQTLEHPLLGSLREALVARRSPVRTTDGRGPTPVLVTGVPRLCELNTAPNAAQGRPSGIYGNRFAAASADQVRSALRIINPPTRSNLIAIAAPACGHGKYALQEIEEIALTAYSGMRAAVLESVATPVEVHTGYWGCGAFGGNPVLMALLQLLAARLAEVDSLVFFTGSVPGSLPFEEARSLTHQLVGSRPNQPLREILQQILRLGLRWGTSDGN